MGTFFISWGYPAGVVELVDTQDLKSCEPYRSYGFDSRPRYQKKDSKRKFWVFFVLKSYEPYRSCGAIGRRTCGSRFCPVPGTKQRLKAKVLGLFCFYILQS